jgi:multiple sugar transport system ATP-binding protein
MRVQMRAEIIKLHQRLQTTMIYVTHDQVEAMTMGTRIVVMDAVPNPQTGLKEGIVQQIDTPLTLYREPANLFVAGFLGNPPMNFLDGSLTKNGSELIFHEKGGSIMLNLGVRPAAEAFLTEEIVLGMRPEDFEPIEENAAKPGKSFSASVDIVEPMGSETNLYLQTGAHAITCRAHATFGHEVMGKRLNFGVNTERLHLFNKKTGLRIG